MIRKSGPKPEPRTSMQEQLRKIFPRTKVPCWKLSHASWREALAHIERLRASPTFRDSGPLEPYVCRHCGSIHVGHERKDDMTP